MSVFISSMLLLGTPIREVIALSFAVTLTNALIAAIPFARKGNLPILPAIVMAVSAAVMVIPGYTIAGSFSPGVLKWFIIGGLFVFGIKVVFFSESSAGSHPVRTTPLPIACLIIPGAIAGGIMGILGGGGALLISMMLILMFRMPVHSALGITFTVMALASVPGLYCYGSDGFLSLPAAAALILPSTLFSYLAARIANALPERKIRRFLGIYLLLISVLLLIKNTGLVNTGE